MYNLCFVLSRYIALLLSVQLVTTQHALSQDISRRLFHAPTIFANLPITRVGGAGTRGCTISGSTNSQKSLELMTLSAERTGLSDTKQPVLYWYINDDVSAPAVEVTFVDEETLEMAAKPIRLPGKIKKGLQAISLVTAKVQLKPNVEYRWHVAIVCDEQDRSGDMVAHGTIMHKKREPSPSSLPDCKSTFCQTIEYARSGHWFDAIHLVNQSSKSDPDYSKLRSLRQRLLKDVALDHIASRLN